MVGDVDDDLGTTHFFWGMFKDVLWICGVHGQCEMVLSLTAMLETIVPYVSVA